MNPYDDEMSWSAPLGKRTGVKDLSQISAHLTITSRFSMNELIYQQKMPQEGGKPNIKHRNPVRYKC